MEGNNGNDYVLIIEDNLVVKGSFKLENAVCNHGFFMMAPNQWCHLTKTLSRPLRLVSNPSISIRASISQSPINNSITITLHNPPTSHLSIEDRQALMDQVRRMLRISEGEDNAVKEFHVIHTQAKEKGFGRLFRTPSLFEDAVKSILLCNITWDKTLKMVAALCEFQSQVCANRVGNKEVVGTEQEYCQTISNFPTSYEIACMMSEEELRGECKLGYRAPFVLNLAKSVESGKLKLEQLQELTMTSQDLWDKVSEIEGFGPFASANLFMCIGLYHKVPVDTETAKLVCHIRGLERCNIKDAQSHVKEMYNKYAPFQCLAYWFDILSYYEGKHGKLSELPSSSYAEVTSVKTRKSYGKVTSIKKKKVTFYYGKKKK